MMKQRISGRMPIGACLIGTCLLAALAGCIAVPGTGVLVTPIGVAGIHSFKPRQTPDSASDSLRAQTKTVDRMTAQTATSIQQD